MENKIKKIINILHGESISDCLTILQKVEREVNTCYSDEKDKIVFKT